jgi:hypothetical protein
VVLAAQPGHLSVPRHRRVARAGGRRGVDLVGNGEVLVGGGAAGDLGVAQGHVEAAVAEHGGDGFRAHAAVDCLGGQDVPELVRVDVR